MRYKKQFNYFVTAYFYFSEYEHKITRHLIKYACIYKNLPIVHFE